MNVSFPNFLLLSLLPLLLSCHAIFAQQIDASTRTGQQTVLDVARKLENYKTIESKIRVRTDLLGQPLVGSGKYAQLQSSSGLLLRMELSIQAGQQTTSIKQISNGQSLWEHWRIGDKERVNHIDLRRVERTLLKHPGTLGMSSSNLASGGLLKLTTQLAANFDFDQQPVRTGQLGGIEVLGLAGIWKSDKLAAAAPNAVEGNQIHFDRLPTHLPHQVELIVGKDDLFPYRVTYQKWDGGDKPRLLPVVTTEFFEVAVGGALDASQFHYEEPTHLQVADQTEVYLESLGIASRPTVDAKR